MAAPSGRYLIGRAVVFTSKGEISYLARTASQGAVQSANLSDEFELIDVRDQWGRQISQAATGCRQTVQVELIPLAESGTNTEAAAAAALALPVPLEKVTLAEFEDADLNGEWNYQGGGTKGYSNDGVARLTLPLARPDGVALNPVTLTAPDPK